MTARPLELHASPEATIVGTGRLLRSGERSVMDVVETCLARIDALEPEIRAWVHVDRDAAREAARRLDAELRSGHDRGPLHGIPVGIKDIIDVADVPTTCGSEQLRGESRPAARDADVVRALRDSGAIILGKTVTTQFACFDPPPTRNPWNADHTPGGSSSGSAAAVASGMCLAAVGTQTGGSITRPATYCGIAACKPGFDNLPMSGIVPVAWSLDHVGPMARTVPDVVAMLAAMGAERIEPSQFVPGGIGSLGNPPRLGQLRGVLEERCDAELCAAVDDAFRSWQSAGATVIDVPLPHDFADLYRHHRNIMAAEAATYHQHRFAAHPDDYQPLIRGLIEDGCRLPVMEYINSRRHHEQFRQQLLAHLQQYEVDAFVCPATTGAAPEAATTGDPACNSPWSYSRLASVSFPIELNDAGLPLGVQLIGTSLARHAYLQAAVWCEAVVSAS